MKYIKSYNNFINEAKRNPKTKTEEVKNLGLNLLGNVINSLQLGNNNSDIKNNTDLEGFEQLVYIALKMEGFPEQAESMKNRLNNAITSEQRTSILYQYLSGGVMKKYGMTPNDVSNNTEIRNLLSDNNDSNLD